MPRRALRVCAWGAWLSLVSVATPARSDTPATPPIETLVRDGAEALRLGRLTPAEELFGRALAAHDAAGRADDETARILTRLAEIAAHHRKLDDAQAYLDRALALLDIVGPESVARADALSVRGMIERLRENLDQAQASLHQAFALLEVAAPESPAMAEVLNKLGMVAKDRFALDRAHDYFERSLALYEKCLPAGIERAHLLHNLGQVAEFRTDLAAAEPLYRRALAIEESLAPQDMAVAHTLNNLGTVALSRGDLASAEAYARRSLALCETLRPDSLELATTLANLGGVLRRRGRYKSAEPLLRRALAIRERRAPADSVIVALGLRQLGVLARNRGDFARAEALARRGLALERRARPQSLRVAFSLRELAEVSLARQRWDDAGRYLAEALAITERVHPGSLTEGQIRHLRGRLLRQRGRLAEAAEEMRCAVDALEQQIGMLGGTGEDRAGYRARRSAFYADLVDVLMRTGDAPQAFRVLERSRARELLEVLATRDLAAAERVPAPVEDERRRVAWQYDRVQKRLAQQDGRAARAVVTRLQDELRELRRRHGALVDQVRHGNGGASLRYPQPFDVAATQAALEPGTLLVSYAVGPRRTYVFAVSRAEGLTAETLPIGRAALERDVELFRRLIQDAAPASPRAAQLDTVGRRLYRRLMGPLTPRLEGCRRVVIVPDGPLHVLPFGALVRGRRGGYLVQWKPYSTALSATVYGELRQRRAHDEEAPTFVAFGDPSLPGRSPRRDDDADGLRSLFSAVEGLRPLPAARREVEHIATLFSGRAEVLVGARATEERVKALPPRVRYVHFATHTVVDHTSPMETALVLATADRENGLLQAWEVLEQVRLDTDLVVLSACDSGLGRELRGEGLWGLTRAFQHAGARSVLASLWRVSDQATAALMVRFYHHLHEGRAKDEALRAAQMEFLEGAAPVRNESGRAVRRDVRTPYHWAAFQLHGDGQ